LLFIPETPATVINRETIGLRLPRSLLHESYTTPHYVPVKRSNIDTIEIDIKTDSGEAIQFNSGKLLIKLHFRPQQNGF